MLLQMLLNNMWVRDWARIKCDYLSVFSNALAASGSEIEYLYRLLQRYLSKGTFPRIN